MKKKVRIYALTLVEQFKDKLAPDHYDALIAAHSYRYDGAALALGIKVGTFKSRLTRARDRLEKLLAAAKHQNGTPLYAKDGTLLDERGNRSIFDDIDK